MSDIDKELIKKLEPFAKTISSRALMPIAHSPEQWATFNTCYQNAANKVDDDGGSVQYGWVFSYRSTADFSSVGYFIATHHAVWKSPKAQLIDVTPFNPDERHRPFTINGRVYFLADDKAQPIWIDEYPAPLPLRFYPLNDGKKLRAYLNDLTAKEAVSCQQYHAELARQIKQLSSRE